MAETLRRLDDAGIAEPGDVCAAGRSLCGFSPSMAAAEKELKRFLFTHIYTREAVDRPARAAGRLVADLAAAYLGDPSTLPPAWRSGLAAAGPERIARRAADYVAGMTDRFAIREYERLFDVIPELV